MKVLAKEVPAMEVPATEAMEAIIPSYINV